MAQKQYNVTGVSCEHCAASIREEVSEVPGVSEVVVDVAGKSVTVHGTGLDDERLSAAIVEAGYGIAQTVAS
ncbi:heavy-metal-associated domain-containing protein [Streptomyces canus]|uniref:heavy-metal-associated domain-containing protein n=1 Tax=Streptomyces canus TaxID=58343 RepID=UPI00386FFC6C|nr:heavy-metal-associated domain-containing protein [Streptomyces canus]